MSQPDSLHLQVRTREGVVAERVLAPRMPIWLGRDPTCDLVLQDLSVSRRHGRIEFTAHGVDVLDSSANGTVINGEVVRGARRSIAAPAAVQIGPFDIVLRVNGHAADPIAAIGSASATRRAPARAERPSLASLSMVRAGDNTEDGDDTQLRRAIHRELIEQLDLANLEHGQVHPEDVRARVVTALHSILRGLTRQIPSARARERLVAELTDEVLGLGPLESLLADDSVSQILVVDPSTIFLERKGKLERSTFRFTDDESVHAVVERIVTPLGRRIDESTPLVDARLPDGSRINAVIPPLAVRGACITIRKFAKNTLQMNDLLRLGAMTARMGRFLENSVKARKSILISGGTGSGKTTLLNVLSAAIPESERIITIEDAAELRLSQSHVVSLESRPTTTTDGKGAYTIGDLIKNALRMRPDRIVVGECCGGETLDMLQAMNTGHGSMTTVHSNSPAQAISRLETLCLMAGVDLPVRAIRQQIASSVHLVVQQARFSDGSRKVTSISEVGGIGPDGEVRTHEIFAFNCSGTTADGSIAGEFLAAGSPSYLDELISHGLVTDGE